jgi:hypothetical protein
MDAELNCPNCGKKPDKCPSGHYLCFECGWQTKGCDWKDFD